MSSLFYYFPISELSSLGAYTEWRKEGLPLPETILGRATPPPPGFSVLLASLRDESVLFNAHTPFKMHKMERYIYNLKETGQLSYD